MKNMVKGAGAPAVPAPRPLTLFNTLITVLKKSLDASSDFPALSRKNVFRCSYHPHKDKLTLAFSRPIWQAWKRPDLPAALSYCRHNSLE